MNRTLACDITSLARPIADYTGLELRIVVENLQREVAHPGINVAEDWSRRNPRTRSEIEQFYSETLAYLYDLMIDSHSIERGCYRAAVIERLKELGVETVLDFGGGVGQDSIEMAQAGFAVTYFDVPGMTSGFARWRFSQAGLPIRLIHDVKELESDKEKFDAIISIEVLEHLWDPIGALRLLRRKLKDKGKLLVTQSFLMIGPDYPSHLPRNRAYGLFYDEILRGCGLCKEVDLLGGHLFQVGKCEPSSPLRRLFISVLCRFHR